MIINKDVIKHIRAIETSLIESLSIDLDNSEHWCKLLNTTKCTDLLKDCVLSQYCISIYTKYVYPMYMYIEFTNNYLTYEVFSEHRDLSVDECKQLVNIGEQILNTIN